VAFQSRTQALRILADALVDVVLPVHVRLVLVVTLFSAIAFITVSLRKRSARWQQILAETPLSEHVGYDPDLRF
jgi:hypothetical protein